MRCDPLEVTLDVVPRARFDMLDLRSCLSSEKRQRLTVYPRSLYWSSHTTAGFLEPATAARLFVGPGVAAYLQAFRALFPEGADYEHDRLERRLELPPAQRLVEPRNADSHLAFIAAGLRPCVTSRNGPGPGVCFVDLDGVNEGRPRTRRTRIIGFHDEEEVARTRLEVPVSSHAVDSINLKDPRLGLYDQLREFVRAHDVSRGRLHLALAEQERHAGLTVNEYETLLMGHDLPEVLRNPLRFAIERGRHALAEPRKVPAKTLGYAKYDLVRDRQPARGHLGPARVAGRAADRAEHGGARRALPAHEAVGQPAGVRRAGPRPEPGRGHLPEPDPRPVGPRPARRPHAGRDAHGDLLTVIS